MVFRSSLMMLVLALTLTVVTSMGVHDASTARMLVTTNTTLNTAYGWLKRQYAGGEGFIAWLAWLCFLEWGLIHIAAGVIT